MPGGPIPVPNFCLSAAHAGEARCLILLGDRIDPGDV
jgi:hypothetical protein